MPRLQVSDTAILQRIHSDRSISPEVGQERSTPGARDSSSDKENPKNPSGKASPPRKRGAKTPLKAADARQMDSNKRRKSNDGRSIDATQGQAARRREIGNKTDTAIYDPEQDERTKRKTLKRLRELNTTFLDSRGEYLQQGSKGIRDTIQEANRLMQDVKQTSVATLDSNLMVNVGDLAYKKINTLALAGGSAGVDVDDFLTRCILYMRSTPTQSTQRNPTQQRRTQPSSNDEDVDEQAVDLDWVTFGADVCRPLSKRPALTSFLLGPLSTQKKARAPTQRRATQRQTYDPALAKRPLELDEAAQEQENVNLTQTCKEIALVLSKTQSEGERLVEQEVEDLPDDPPDDTVQAILRKHHLSDNGQVPLFNFCINPKSFGQTIENFFYVSFLVKEGRVGIDFDRQGMPTLGMSRDVGLEERQAGETQRNQAVFTLDFDTYEALVQECEIAESIIPHRQESTHDDGTLPNRHTQQDRSV